MIPTDLATRTRLIQDSQVQALSATPEIPAELPALTPGQRITARVESTLSNGSFKAEVDGKMVNLTVSSSNSGKPVEQLSSIGPGQTLELVVTGKNQRTIFARVADQAAGDMPVLSKPAQLIGSLLARGAPEAAPLAKGAPLMQAPSPEAFRALPQQLRQAVAESGLFYESHQAQWVAGKLPAESLLREPQGSHSPLLTVLQGNGSAVGTQAQASPPGEPPAAGSVGGNPTSAANPADQAALEKGPAPAQASLTATAADATRMARISAGAGLAVATDLAAEAGASHGGQQTAAQPALPFRLLQGVLLYESEQTRWDSAQASQSPSTADSRQTSSSAPRAEIARTVPPQSSGGAPASTQAPPPLVQPLALAQTSEGRSPQAAGIPMPTQPSGPMPAELQPLVQQQLDAADSRTLIWQGQVWPDQNMEWRIEEDQSRAADEDTDQPKQWKTSLRLTMPNLGQLNAVLTLGPAGVSVTVATDQVDALRQAAPGLADSLAALGVPAQSIQVIANEPDFDSVTKA
ncbi:MAG: flagellar hook-length control protein FliK [Rhodocyclaceae bacterium]|nr:flagellar hook-length control protein FliK [Rhodocyclaceae bacterium]